VSRPGVRAPGAVIVVAGGRSRRFGSDKLGHRIGCRTLLERTVEAAGHAGPVVLVTAADPPPSVVVAVSESPRWGGPCAAIAAGVDAVASLAPEDADVLILPADLADPVSAVAALLAEGGVLVDGDGHPQWLLARAPLAGLRARIAELRRERPTLDGLSAAALLSVVESRHPVADDVCADIDVPSDLPQSSPSSADRRAKELAHGTV
jgi:molybdopterin-guanine dinucleotide biosynthesis protein A